MSGPTCPQCGEPLGEGPVVPYRGGLVHGPCEAVARESVSLWRRLRWASLPRRLAWRLRLWRPKGVRGPERWDS